MTRGNPRPGRQEMPDRSDDTERLALRAKGAAGAAADESHRSAETMLEEARAAARKAAKQLRAARKKSAAEPTP